MQTFCKNAEGLLLSATLLTSCPTSFNMQTYRRFAAATAGFTLIELLIAMALSVMVMTMLAFGVYAVSRDWRNSSTMLEEQLDKALLILQLERALEGSFPHTYYDDDKKKRLIYFEGDDKTLTWVSTVSPQRRGGLTAWQLDKGDKNFALKLKVVPAFADNPTERLEKAEGQDIFADYSATFEYLYIKQSLGEDKPEWLTKWSIEKWEADRGVARLPNAVRIKLEHKDHPQESLEIIGIIQAQEQTPN